MVRRVALDHLIGVRIPVSQPILFPKSVKTILANNSGGCFLSISSQATRYPIYYYYDSVSASIRFPVADFHLNCSAASGMFSHTI
jgi:hypothetical protein